VAVTVLQQVGQERPVPVDDAPEVHAHDPLPLGQLDRRVAAHRPGHAGVVAHDVHPTEACERLVPEPVDGVRVRHVDDHGQRVDARRPHRRLGVRQPRPLDVGQHDVHARGRQPLSEGAPDPARRSGDHCRLAAELAHAAR
jgi:hypothetical protein